MLWCIQCMIVSSILLHYHNQWSTQNVHNCEWFPDIFWHKHKILSHFWRSQCIEYSAEWVIGSTGLLWGLIRIEAFFSHPWPFPGFLTQLLIIFYEYKINKIILVPMCPRFLELSRWYHFFSMITAVFVFLLSTILIFLTLFPPVLKDSSLPCTCWCKTQDTATQLPGSHAVFESFILQYLTFYVPQSIIWIAKWNSIVRFFSALTRVDSNKINDSQPVSQWAKLERANICCQERHTHLFWYRYAPHPDVL